ncbi:hypothetical protein HMPREF0872_02300 [Veillonella montpellierensis DNF00314]|uniref:Uncharacterized protein n=1 Tax=Veillonella montpellierensis DNF00314 TaxID=1401067 RepID=A0A096AMN4_9FIRM|nr:hypothetical protein [Veillonella montpellierensis]KGF47941.1 hypothetical protein HMPREF0872_02300 [Veillonella montpellierensis DNF00314]
MKHKLEKNGFISYMVLCIAMGLILVWSLTYREVVVMEQTVQEELVYTKNLYKVDGGVTWFLLYCKDNWRKLRSSYVLENSSQYRLTVHHIVNKRDTISAIVTCEDKKYQLSSQKRIELGIDRNRQSIFIEQIYPY